LLKNSVQILGINKKVWYNDTVVEVTTSQICISHFGFGLLVKENSMKYSIKKKVTSAVFALALGLFGVVAPVVTGIDTQKANAATCWSNLLSSSVHNDSCYLAQFASYEDNGNIRTFTPRGPKVSAGNTSVSTNQICYVNAGVLIWTK
jgi:hypothetical protein